MESLGKQIEANEKLLGCDEARYLHHGCAADTSAASACHQAQYGPKSQWNISNTLLDKELK